MMRPRPARWFEVLCPRADSARLVGSLAATGAVEIEVREAHTREIRLRELSDGLAAYRALLPRYGRYWKHWPLSQSDSGAPPPQVLGNALKRLEQWRLEAAPLIDDIQQLEEEHNRIQLCLRVMEALGDSRLNFTLINAMGPLLQRVAAVLPDDAATPAIPDQLLHTEIPLNPDRYLLAVGIEADIAPLRERIKSVGGRQIDPPPWLLGVRADARRQVR